LEAFRAASHRTPISAGGPYPADVAGLRQQLDGYLADVNETPRANIRGLVSPHIDFERGGPVYAAVWQAAAEAARAADLVVILGTDHYGGDGSVTLTRQHYATPYGVLPTDQEAVATLAEAIGQAPAFADELHHRTEHAIELAAVWLHHIRGGKPCSLLPVLCGSFSTFINGERDFNTEPQFRALIAGLQAQVRTRNVLFVAAADLAHVGPAFGGPPIDLRLSCTLKAADDLLIAQMHAGNAAGFLGKIQDVADRFNVCGVPPITLMLDILAPSRGELIAYDRCPADAENASTVTICGMVFR
ncbi:MAG: AmmeMemoRadiSam system protein B, partial [Anaerolineae bacterium]|nr:AmmeMemoRadiSam system protein B [Anaerolineae bacterium]